MSKVESPLAYLLDDPTALIYSPARLRERVIHYLAVYEGPEATLSLLEKLPASTQHSLFDMRVELLCSLGRAEEAVAFARERTAIRPSDTAYCLLAKCLHKAGEKDEAVQLLTDLIERNGGLITVWGTLGDLSLAAGNTARARECFDHILEARPGSATGLRGLIRCAMATGDYDKARELIELVLGASEVRSNSLLQEAIEIYERLGDSSRAGQLHEELEKQRHTALDSIIEELKMRAQAKPLKVPLNLPREINSPVHQQVHELDPWAVVVGSELFSSDLDKPNPKDNKDVQRHLREVFGHDIFRPGQGEVIDSVLQGQDTLAIMPTGSGKSLCYQLPSLLLPNATLVISPLIALMKDQIDSLPPSVQQQSTFINSTLDRGELSRRLMDVVSGKCRLVYAAPERLRQRPFLHAMLQAGVSLLVVDEAHCVSMWGHDFRPDYLFIAKAMAELGNPTLLAMTATATPGMAREIAEQFGRRLHLVRTSMHRPNLRLEVQVLRNDEEKMQALLEICKTETGAGIIYVNSREKAERLAQLLRRKARISAQHYHAKMEKEEREAAQDRFMTGLTRIIMATVAFGMGVDKGNVRFIVHYDLPHSLEGYSQEVGRAGRDGLTARCTLFYTSAARSQLTRWAYEGRLSLEGLRAVYRVMRGQARESCNHDHALITSDEIQEALVEAGVEDDLESNMRVAVSLLEKAGLVTRHFDLPRVCVVKLLDDSSPDGDFARFVSAMRLRIGLSVELNSLEAARTSAIPLEEFEGRLLLWQEQGLLNYRGAGRDMHVQLLDAPSDSRERLEGLLESSVRKQEEQIGQICYYATAAHCRHAILAAHFGERLSPKCSACDHCSPGRPKPVPEREKPFFKSDEVPREIAIACLQNLPNPVGKTGLVKTLRGSVDCPMGAERTPQFGALKHESKAALGRLVDAMVAEGLLEAYERDGYPLLRVPGFGRRDSEFRS